MQNGNDGRCPDGLPTYPTPNGSKSASRSGQNGGCNQSRTRLVTELLRCDALATREGNPAKTGGFIRLCLIDRHLSALRRLAERGRDAPPPSPGCRTPPFCTSAAREPCSHPGTIACRSAPRICAPG